MEAVFLSEIRGSSSELPQFLKKIRIKYFWKVFLETQTNGNINEDSSPNFCGIMQLKTEFCLWIES